MAFARDYELLNVYLTTHDIKLLFEHVQSDDLDFALSSNQSATRDAHVAGKELSYRQFLEFVTGIAHFTQRNPYYTLHDRVDKFIIQHLKSRKLPIKTYRN